MTSYINKGIHLFPVFFNRHRERILQRRRDRIQSIISSTPLLPTNNLYQSLPSINEIYPSLLPVDNIDNHFLSLPSIDNILPRSFW
ncbi:15925_t:CDS:2 [Gigaspora margarita]|uniref:15925_t:CDS:1 n=1 Tax=Gigaspora margarita TaxID=4874 RepID=A0ABN7V227_GIGMA|nr:15925_t:CDS:2 [Gigaspora margarita]